MRALTPDTRKRAVGFIIRAPPEGRNSIRVSPRLHDARKSDGPVSQSSLLASRAVRDAFDTLDFRRRLDPVARDLFHLGDHVALAGGGSELDQPQFVDADISIALEVVLGDRLGVRRKRHIDVGSLTPSRLD